MKTTIRLWGSWMLAAMWAHVMRMLAFVYGAHEPLPSVLRAALAATAAEQCYVRHKAILRSNGVPHMPSQRRLDRLRARESIISTELPQASARTSTVPKPRRRSTTSA